MSLDLSGISALILAGEREGPNLLLQSETAVSKAEIDIGGRPMLDHVLAAVRESGLAQPLYLAGGHETTRARLSGSETGRGIEHLPAGPGPAASVLSSLDRIGRYPLLVTTSDHPLLSPGMIRVFIERSLVKAIKAYIKKLYSARNWNRRKRIQKLKRYLQYFPGGKKAVIRADNSHRSHLHLRIKCPEGDRKCIP